MEKSIVEEPNPKRTTRLYNLISACLAFLMWGGWAYLVNSGNVIFNVRLIASITQGISSFIITLILVRLVAWIYRFSSDLILRFILFIGALISLDFKTVDIG